MYKITLEDGKELKGLELNGNNFIANTVIEDEVFEDNLVKITMTDEEGNTEEYKDMKIIKNKPIDGKSWLVFKQKTEKEKLEEWQELQDEELEAIIEALEEE